MDSDFFQSLHRRSVSSAICGLFCVFLMGGGVHAAPVDLSPPKNSLGFADRDGYLRYIQHYGSLRFQGGFVLPLRFDFWTGRAGESSDFGWNGWHCGAFEAKSERYGGNRFLKITLLCSKILFLEQSEDDPLVYKSFDGAWTGVISGNEISVSRPDGWDLRFLDNKVSSLRTDKGVFVIWNRNENGHLISISEKKSSSAPEEEVASLSWSRRGNGDWQVDSIEIDGSPVMLLDYDPGKPLLTSLAWQGVQAPQQFLQTETSLQITSPTGNVRLFRWQSQTNQLVTDGIHQYRIISGKGEQEGVKTIVQTTPDGAKLSQMVNPNSGVSEFTDEQGRKVRTSRFSKGGPNHGQILRMERIHDDEAVTQTLLENRFDEAGNLVSRSLQGNPVVYAKYAEGKIDPWLLPDKAMEFSLSEESEGKSEDTYEIVYRYENGRHVSTLVNERVMYETSYDEVGNQTSIRVTDRFQKVASYGDQGPSRLTIEIEGFDSQIPFSYLQLDDPSVTADTIVEKSFDETGRLMQKKLLDGRRVDFEYFGDGTVRRETLVAADGQSPILMSTYDRESHREEEIVVVTKTDLLNGKSKIFHLTPNPFGEGYEGTYVDRREMSTEKP